MCVWLVDRILLLLKYVNSYVWPICDVTEFGTCTITRHVTSTSDLHTWRHAVTFINYFYYEIHLYMYAQSEFSDKSTDFVTVGCNPIDISNLAAYWIKRYQDIPEPRFSMVEQNNIAYPWCEFPSGILCVLLGNKYSNLYHDTNCDNLHSDISRFWTQNFLQHS